MRVVYVCGYGRSGSTLLGRVLAFEQQAVAIGEATHIGSSRFLSTSQCSCGRKYPTCDYWADVHRRLEVSTPDTTSSNYWQRDILESTAGLFVPKSMLRRLVVKMPFSERYPSVSFAQGVRVLAEAAGSTFVDISKTTRLTANRARLISAAGLELDLYLAWRPLLEVMESYRSAHERRGRRVGRGRAMLAVSIGRALALIAAKRCAHSMEAPLIRVMPAQASARTEGQVPLSSFDHMIAGNRSRHLPLG